MIEVKVRKTGGDSLGLALPQEVVDRLQVRAGDRLFLIEASEGGYRIMPCDPAFERNMEKAEGIIGRYTNALRTLSE